jgi:AcrR family transcriptional regulator
MVPERATQSDQTVDRIVLAALELLISRGVKGTNLTEVASHAGVTRVTVYRHFGDKEGLFRGICRKIVSIFEKAADGEPTEPFEDFDARLQRLGMDLAALPQGNLLARLEEINRRYPGIYGQFTDCRRKAINTIFQHALAVATRDGALRDDVNLDVLKVIFWAATVGLIENPALVSSNVSLAEVFATVTTLFRHGILKHCEGATTSEQG